MPNEVLEPLLERKGDAWRFTTVSGGHVRHNNSYTRVWRPACAKAKLSPNPRIHDARNTHASWLLAAGVRLEVIQERLRHEDYGTTRKGLRAPAPRPSQRSWARRLDRVRQHRHPSSSGRISPLTCCLTCGIQGGSTSSSLPIGSR